MQIKSVIRSRFRNVPRAGPSPQCIAQVEQCDVLAIQPTVKKLESIAKQYKHSEDPLDQMRTPVLGNTYPRRYCSMPLRSAAALPPALSEEELSKIELPELFLKRKPSSNACDIVFTDE